MYVGSHVDNIDVDRGTGDLWIGSHYVLHDIADVLSAYEKNRTEAAGMISSSQVKCVAVRDNWSLRLLTRAQKYNPPLKLRKTLVKVTNFDSIFYH